MKGPAIEVPRADLAAQYRELEEEILEVVRTMLGNAELVLGPTVERFERAIADRIGVAEAIGTSSGTSALHLALLAAGVKPGGEVIVPAYTFAATAAAVVHCGAKPVFVDVEAPHGCIDARRARDAMTDRTQAVIAVHLFGRPALVAELAELGVPVIEDAAQAIGAVGAEGAVGGVGSFGCFSFHPSKNLGVAGDGGMVTTSDPVAAQRMRHLRNHGRDANGRHVAAGFNYRLDALQAGIGLVKLKRLDVWNARRRELAQTYSAALRGFDLVLPEVSEGHVFHQYAIATDRRDELAEHLRQSGIASAKFYARALYAEPAFAAHAPASPCEVAEWMSGRSLCLPLYPELSDTQQQKVIACIRRFFEANHAQSPCVREIAE